MITGFFKEVSVPEVEVGQDIKATIDFYALNPGALYWKTFLIVGIPELGIRKELDAARELGQEGGRRKTYTLGKMPDKRISISFFIFAHDDAGYDWDWVAFRTWLDGFVVRVTHLAFEYKFIGPKPAPPIEEEIPAEGIFSGMITAVRPSQIPAGEPLNVYVSFTAHTVDALAAIRWHTKVTVRLDSLAASDSQIHMGYVGDRASQIIRLGTMPKRNLSGKVSLIGYIPPFGSDVVLDTKSISVAAGAPLVSPGEIPLVEGAPPGVTPPEVTLPALPGGISWTMVLVALAVIVALAPGKKAG